MIYNNITELIGNTPLLKIDKSVHGLQNFEIYSKLEYYNPFGSLKDRIAWNMLQPVLEDAIQHDKAIVESSSGNTAKALAILAKIYGLNFKTITNRIKVPEVRMMLQFLGADIEELPGLSDCPDPNDPNDPVTIASQLQEQNPDKFIYTDQYYNTLNWKAHYKAGQEIAKDLSKVDYYFGTLGTCGSTFGAVSALRDIGMQTKVVGVVSSAASWVPGGRNINELWETGFFDKEFYEDIIQADIKTAIQGMQTLNQKCGILAGPTTGLNFQSMLEYLKKVDQSIPPNTSNPKQVAVFIACDRAEPYMNYIKNYSPELFNLKTNTKPSVMDITESDIPDNIDLNPDQLSNLMQSQNPLIIDIRGSFAFSIGHLKGSLNILDELFLQIIEQGQTLPKSTPIIIVCSIGKISPRYTAFLRQIGYEAYSLHGGVNQWKKQGYQLEVNLNHN